MRLRILIIPALTLIASAPALADWVDLKSGVSLRGIDFKKRSSRCLFTLETGEQVSIAADQVAGVRKSPPDETVELGGKQVTLREKVRILKMEEESRRKQAIRDLEKWAAGGKNASSARDVFLALPAPDRERFLASALKESSYKSARILAASELSAHKGPRAIQALSRSLVKDRSPPVRDASLHSLVALEDPSTGEHFVPFLGSSSPHERVRAANALETFPTRKAVPYLIERVRLAWVGFGRGYFFQGEERSYISGYNLVSGGTGFSIVEVADPEVSRIQTGVVLDVKVRKVEIEAEVRALRKITGQDFGADVRRWQEWWKATGG